MGGQADGGRRASSEVHLLVNIFFFFFFFFLQNYMLPLFFSGLLSFLVGMKRRTSRRVACNRDKSHCLHYILISPDVRGLPFG